MMSLASSVAALAVLPMSSVAPIASWGATAQYEVVDSFSTQASASLVERFHVGGDCGEQQPDAQSKASGRAPASIGYAWIGGSYSSSLPVSQSTRLETVRYLCGTSAAEAGLPAARVARSLYAQEVYLSDLGDDWDGYGAAVIDRDVISAFFAELRSLKSELPDKIVDVVPGSDGSLQAEWRHQGYLLTYGRTEDAEAELCLSFDGNLEAYLSGNNARASLVPMLRHVFDVDTRFARSVL